MTPIDNFSQTIELISGMTSMEAYLYLKGTAYTPEEQRLLLQARSRCRGLSCTFGPQ